MSVSTVLDQLLERRLNGTLSTLDRFQKTSSFASSKNVFKLNGTILFFLLSSPYEGRLLRESEHSFFSRKNEIGVYYSYFAAELRFPVDHYLVIILNYYDMPLCWYTPSFLGCIAFFISSLKLVGVPCSHFLGLLSLFLHSSDDEVRWAS